MKLDKIKELVQLMKDNDLTELEIVDGETKIALKRGGEPAAAPQVIALGTNGVSAGLPVASAAVTQEVEDVETPEEHNYLEIVAPIVGTYYTSPSPSADPFVEVGSKVDEESVVCIIEAMKVMNEIKSGVKGTIKEMLVDSGSAVEYGQMLFYVEPE
ncbi:MAG: acetyl-CoA carboxylase biotin carboxyl carrier protein [Planctomycetes bacterium]|nr:acetyl-CoA carboxylase biotin carboxyl carrier protein [Planctomycetota bacterium]